MKSLHPSDKANAPWRRECWYSSPNSLSFKCKNKPNNKGK